MPRQLKNNLRKDALKRRSQFSGTDRARAAEMLTDQLLSLEIIKRARTISAYVPFGGEINILPALGALFDSEDCVLTRVVMPRVADEERLTLHECSPSLFTDVLGGGAFVEGYGGILEPPASWTEVPFDEVDVIIVPGVAFDRNCYRIGYGKGFYDRMLCQRKPESKVIGVIFDELLYDDMPLEDHDVAMDLVVSPHEILTRA